MTMKSKIFTKLVVDGKRMTAEQLAAQLQTTPGTVKARISELRYEGYSIYANRKTDTKGRTKTFYKAGAPSRRVVAAGYRAMSLGLVA
jgi:predicted ArsR family transcriptional regulator